MRMQNALFNFDVAISNMFSYDDVFCNMFIYDDVFCNVFIYGIALENEYSFRCCHVPPLSDLSRNQTRVV